MDKDKSEFMSNSILKIFREALNECLFFKEKNCPFFMLPESETPVELDSIFDGFSAHDQGKKKFENDCSHLLNEALANWPFPE